MVSQRKVTLYLCIIVAVMLLMLPLFFTSTSATETYILNDNFDDGNWSSNPVWNLNGGTPTCVDSNSHSASYSVRFNGTSYQNMYYEATNTFFPNQNSFWLYIHYLTPGVIQTLFLVYDLSWASVGANLKILNDDGTYKIISSVGATDTEITTISIDAWHQIYINNTVRNSFKFFLDSVQQGTTWTGNYGAYDASHFIMVGKGVGTDSCDYYMDDVQLMTGSDDPTPPITDILSFTSSPIITIINPLPYSYSATTNHTATFEKDSCNATWISVGSSNGTVYGIPPYVSIPTVYGMSIKATNVSCNPSNVWQNYSITVYPELSITSTPITTVTNPNTYSYHCIANLTVTWTLSGNITGWASIDSGGYINGTPPIGYINHTYFNVEINATNIDSGTVWQNYTLYVDHEILITQITTIAITAISNPDNYVYDANANIDVTWNLTSSASWLNITVDGIVYGTPPTVNTSTFFTINIRATNTTWGNDYQNYTLIVSPVPPEFVFTNEVIFGLLFYIICLALSLIGFRYGMTILTIIPLLVSLLPIVSMLNLFGSYAYILLLFYLPLALIPIATYRK